MSSETIIMDEKQIYRAITRISHEILERNKGSDNLILFGIKTRGIVMAEEISKKIEEIEQKKVMIKELDISHYRDDIENEKDIENNPIKIVETFNIQEKTVIIIDDVLFTGRTARASLEAIIVMGRPKKIQLAVLIDRGHRELPISPDFVGKNTPSAKNEQVNVMFEKTDGINKVVIKKG